MSEGTTPAVAGPARTSKAKRPHRKGPWSADRKPTRPRTRVYRTETCPWCGLQYERFRHPSVPGFAAVQEELLAAAQVRADAGDYSLPCRLSAILGRMREYKLAAWTNEHLEWCKQEHESTQELEEAPF